MKKMKALTALMVVGAVLLGAVLLVPMSLATNDGTSANGTSSANGDCTMDQAKDGTCDRCTGDQDMLRKQDRVRAQDGSCDGSACPDGVCDPACDQVRERLQLQDGQCSGEMTCAQMQVQEQSMAQTQCQTGTMSQVCAGKA